jgi:hypothetical protein
MPDQLQVDARPPSDTPIPPQPVHWVWDLVLILAVLVGFPAYIVVHDYMQYQFGLNNEFPLRLEELLVLGGLAGCWIAVFFRLLHYWHRIPVVGRTLRLAIVIWGLLGWSNMLGPPSSRPWWSPARLVEPSHWDFLHGLKVRVLERADFKAIRAWGEANPDWKETWREDGMGPDPEKTPDCLKLLIPGSVHMNSKEKMIEIIWGCGFLHWGLTIQPENEPIPEEDNHTQLEIAPGAYVWEERG